MPLIKGSKLNPSQRRLVLDAFPWRWTTGNTRRVAHWHGIDGKPTIPLVSDEQWLAEHAFHFTADGKRLKRVPRHCEPAFMADTEKG